MLFLTPSSLTTVLLAWLMGPGTVLVLNQRQAGLFLPNCPNWIVVVVTKDSQPTTLNGNQRITYIEVVSLCPKGWWGGSEKGTLFVDPFNVPCTNVIRLVPKPLYSKSS